MQTNSNQLQINRSQIRIQADIKKVILSYLDLGAFDYSDRAAHLVKRIMSLDESEVERLYQEVYTEFNHRHRMFEKTAVKHFEFVKHLLPDNTSLTHARKMLMGAYFTKEYSIRSAALFNPSIVAHPDQSGVADSELRFIMSLRAVGEGHISSIEFRCGVVTAEGDIRLDEDSGFVTRLDQDMDKLYNSLVLKARTAVLENFNQNIFDEFQTTFSKADYLNTIPRLRHAFDEDTLRQLDDIVDSNYDVESPEELPLNERVIFPTAKQESNGIEDVRFVEFVDHGKSTFIGTFTAYDGHRISPQLVITTDFLTFKIRTMYGKGVNGKGFALFPEKINNQYVMVGRQGGENITMMYSDDLYIWKSSAPIITPGMTWGLIQLGNGGSPIKTDAGWLLITHAVGAMRKYVLSAVLLDLDNPSKVIKFLNQPLLSPNDDEREGYVPNVVYTCGALKFKNLLIIPYAMSDSATTFATIDVNHLLNQMESC